MKCFRSSCMHAAYSFWLHEYNVSRSQNINSASLDRQFLKRLRRDILDFPASLNWEPPCVLSPVKPSSSHPGLISLNDLCSSKYSSYIQSESDDEAENSTNERRLRRKPKFHTILKPMKSGKSNFTEKARKRTVFSSRTVAELPENGTSACPNSQRGVGSHGERRNVGNRIRNRIRRDCIICRGSGNRRRNIHYWEFIDERCRIQTELSMKWKCASCQIKMKKCSWTEPTMAVEGNFFEAVNMTLNHFSVHHVDRSLAQTGQPYSRALNIVF